jgi:O-antigen ligase
MLRFIVGLFDDPENDPSITSRTDSFDFAWAFTAENPLFGRGFGTFLPKYRIFDNQYLVQLVSVGVIGTLALVALGWVAISEMRRVARTTKGAETLRTRDLTAALSGAIAAGFVSMAFFDAFAFPMTMGTLFLLLGIAAAVARLNRDLHPSW